MRNSFVLWLLAIILVWPASRAFAVITVTTGETWDGGEMHGVTPTGAGTAADPYVYTIPDGMTLTGAGIIRTGDRYVVFDFSTGTGGLEMAASSYFDLTGSIRQGDPGEITIVLGHNSLTGAGDFKTVDITKDSKDVIIGGSGDVDVNSIYTHVRDARAGDVSVDVGGSASVGSIDTQDEAAGGNDAGNVTIRGDEVTVGAVDTRCLRTDSATASSGAVVVQARDSSGINSLNNTLNLYGAINTDAAAGYDGDITTRGVIVTLHSGFGAVSGSGSLDIHAGLIQHGMTGGDLFIDNSGGGYTAIHDVPWGPTVSFEGVESGDLETVSPAVFNVVLNQAQHKVVTVDYMTYSDTATESLDFIGSAGTLVFDPCETIETISIDIVGDDQDEDDEIFWVVLDNPVGPNVALGESWFHAYTIIDPRPYVEFDAQVSGGMEDVSPAYIAVSLSWPTNETVTVDYQVTGGTATNGVDYNLPAGTLVFDPCQVSRRLTIPIFTDPCQECAETIVLRLANPTNARLGGNQQHTYTVTQICSPPFADSNTAALWLFDETEYPYTTLTDAGEDQYDLRLADSGRLIAGKFGNALRMSPGTGYNLYYAEWKGILCAIHMAAPAGEPSGLWGPTIAPKKLLAALASEDWTCEFWLKLSAVPSGEVAVVHLGHAYDPGTAFNLTAGAASFKVHDAYAGFEATCATNAAWLSDGQWHHVALTSSAGQVSHYLDGHLQADPVVSPIAIQPVPDSNIPESLADTTYGIFDDSRDYEKFRQHRFNVSVGEDRHGNMQANGAIDELRFSNVARYSGAFDLPDSLSRNYARIPTSPQLQSGPALLFAPDSGPGPVQLGSRKHLFIDEVIIDTKEEVQLTVNPPVNPQLANRSLSSGDYWAVDHNDQVYLFTPDSYASDKGITRLWVSTDGVNFDDPELGVIEYGGSTANNFVLYLSPMWAGVFKDLNPNVSPQEQFKLTAWSANRGIYLYSSPDLVHWRRNETIMLPLVSGGGCETFWDDQRGLYVNFLKRDPQFRNLECPSADGRTAVGFDTGAVGNIWKPWPYSPMNTPYYDTWSLPVVTCEGPVVFPVNEYGQVYRTRAIKYPWAPDTYLAFIWRMAPGEIRSTDLGVSRDGINWTTYAGLGMYMPTGGTFNGEIIVERLAHGGLIRRGDEIWQYADFGTGPHGAGEEFFVRVSQRLDGFVSLDAGATTGVIVTRPLVFCGNQLILNVLASGFLKVAILNEAGDAIAGYDSSDCDPIVADSVRQVVAWNGDSNVGSLSGTVVRLKFEMQNTKLYAFQFTRSGDFNGDGVVDYLDLRTLSDAWLWSGPAGGVAPDVDKDGWVDFGDFASLASQWIRTCP
ncbi:MAG TPA: Calx-beta domain-containing protein [Sedimentisphaerales bacterium]|nr:Calx-beta domain-containing protein [Sedimentisphaerales bacterium]